MSDEEKIKPAEANEPAEAKGEEKAVAKKKKKVKRHVPRAHVFVQSTFNNTIISVADQQGGVLFQISAGKSGFKGPKKATPYAASAAVRAAIDKFREFGIIQADVVVKGAGSGREAAIRALHGCGINVASIKDKTPVPHNGPRPPKPRRV